jgi:hypothetical protein
MSKMAPDAQGGTIHGMVAVGGIDLHEPSIRGSHNKRTPNSAEAADGEGFALGGACIVAILGHQGAGRTQGYAGSAKGAARVFQGSFMDGGGSGAKAPPVVIDSAHGHEIVVGPDALSAEDALCQIPDNKRVRLLKLLVVGHGVEACHSNPQFPGKESQLTSIPLVTNDAGLGMVGHDKTDNVRPVLSEVGGVCLNGHAGCDRRDTGSHQPAALFIFNDTEPARPGGLEVRMMTQGGYPDAVSFSRLKNAGPSLSNDVHPIDAKTDVFHDTPRIAFLSQFGCVKVVSQLVFGTDGDDVDALAQIPQSPDDICKNFDTGFLPVCGLCQFLDDPVRHQT